MDRAYSILEIKAVDDEKRIIEGIATTPTPDRIGDVVEPMGAEFSLPLPLLWQHDTMSPIGNVTTAKKAKDGITFKAQIAKIDEAGPLKDMVDLAWQSVKAKLVRGLSIGFRAIERSFMETGIRFTQWEWLELSLVTIPMNSEATISAIKSLDTALLAASGNKSKSGVVRLSSPGVPGSVKPNRPEATDVKTIQEQIAEWEAKRIAKATRKEAIMNKAAEEGRTLDDAEETEHDTITDELKQIDKHLVRLDDMQKANLLKAREPAGADPDEAARSRQPGRVQIVEPKLEKGIGFTRYVMCMAAAKGDVAAAERVAKVRYPDYAPLHHIMRAAVDFGGIDLSLIRRAAVGASSTSDNNSHSALVNYQDLAGEFVAWLRPQTIVGKFGTGNIPSLRAVPFNVRVPRQTSKASAYWVGEGKPKPLSRFNTEQITLDFHKVATICPLTKELVRFSSPSAEALVRGELAAAVIERIDIDFIDPAKTAVAGVSPASITNGATTMVSGGDTVAFITADLQNLFSEFIQENMPLSSTVIIMNQNVALALSMILTANGSNQYPGMGINGGTLAGVPVITSQYVPEAIVVLVAASEIYLADDGNVTVDMSEEASLEMLDGSLVQDGNTGTGTSLVSMFQTNMVAIRAEREITWRTRRNNAVAYMTSVNWGGTPGSGDV